MISHGEALAKVKMTSIKATLVQRKDRRWHVGASRCVGKSNQSGSKLNLRKARGGSEMGQLAKGLTCQHGDLNLIPKTHKKVRHGSTHICYLNTERAERVNSWSPLAKWPIDWPVECPVAHQHLPL